MTSIIAFLVYPSKGIGPLWYLEGSGLDSISLNDTEELTLLGSSIPIVFLPGIGAWILTSLAANAKAISLWILSNLFTLVPAFSSSSYWVTVGPILTWTILPDISKSCSTFSNSLIFSLAASSFSLLLTLFTVLSKFNGGNW